MSSFKDAKTTVSSVMSKLEEVRKKALKELPVVRSAAFNVISDIVGRIFKIIDTAEGIESRLEVKGKGLAKFCGNWVIIKDEKSITLMRLKPLRLITYNAESGIISIANSELRIDLSGNNLKIKFRGNELVSTDYSLESINSQVDMIKTLARYLMDLTSIINDVLGKCLKSLTSTL